MKALLCKELGQPLVVEDIPAQALAPGQVRVAMRGAGVNFADLLLISGKYQEKPALPFSPGMEGAGEVVEAGSGVTAIRPGMRVITLTSWGACASELVLPASDVIPIPAEMDDITAAGFAVVYGTAHLGLWHRARLQPGEVLLVHAAAGGVGLAAVEIGKAMGARVIGSAGGSEKCALAKAHGADDVFDYRTEDIRERVKALTDGRGADVVFDPVGGDVFDASLRCLNWEGRLLVVGFASGRIPQAPANILLVKNIAVLSVYWGAYRRRNPALYRQSFAALFEMYRKGQIRPEVSRTFNFSEANEAYRMLGSRESTGKLVLVP
jgi:NADPH2:quinone reductase